MQGVFRSGISAANLELSTTLLLAGGVNSY